MINFIHKTLKLNNLTSRFLFWTILLILLTSILYVVTYSAIDKTRRIDEINQNLHYGLNNQKVLIENWVTDRMEEVRFLASIQQTETINLSFISSRFLYYNQFFEQLDA